MNVLQQSLLAVHGLIRRIPFYPLSALSMFVGCYLLNNALALRPGQTGKLLVLLFVLNLYEALLIGLGLFLILRRGQLDDGRTILLLEALFIADVTLLVGECFASSFLTGLLVSGAAMVLAFLKVGIVFRALAPGLEHRGLAVLAVPMLLLFATPGVFALLARGGFMVPVVVYLAWWVGASTVVLLALQARWADAVSAPTLPVSAEAFRRVLAFVLPASLLLHIGTTAWVHRVDFYWANLGPVFVALGIGRLLVDVSWVPEAWRYRFPLLALFFSLGAPAVLVAQGPLGFAFSPLRAVLGALALAYLLSYPIHRSVVLAAASVAGLVAGLTGHSVTAMADNVGRVFSTIGEGGVSLIPRTATGWGVLAVVFAFVFLGLGALASLWKPSAPPAEPKAVDLPADDASENVRPAPPAASRNPPDP